MTDKRKKLARDLSSKTGMSHQAAVNVLEHGKDPIAGTLYVLVTLDMADPMGCTRQQLGQVLGERLDRELAQLPGYVASHAIIGVRLVKGQVPGKQWDDLSLPAEAVAAGVKLLDFLRANPDCMPYVTHPTIRWVGDPGVTFEIKGHAAEKVLKAHNYDAFLDVLDRWPEERGRERPDALRFTMILPVPSDVVVRLQARDGKAGVGELPS
jgi:hypothetical protein